MSWRIRRQLVFIAIGLAIIVIFFVLPAVFLFRSPKVAGCGINCPSLFKDLSVLWGRSFQISPGIYNAVAYVENPNSSGAAVAVPYRFKLYDSANVLVSEREGETSIPPGKTFAIFEGTIETGALIPSYTIFEFTGAPNWRTVAPDPILDVAEVGLSTGETTQQLQAIISNHSPAAASAIEVVAILYDSSGNAITASRTMVDFISGGGSEPIYFTWPEPFSETVSRTEFIYRISRDK